jgi:hypothetical protein
VTTQTHIRNSRSLSNTESAQRDPLQLCQPQCLFRILNQHLRPQTYKGGHQPVGVGMPSSSDLGSSSSSPPSSHPAVMNPFAFAACLHVSLHNRMILILWLPDCTWAPTQPALPYPASAAHFIPQYGCKVRLTIQTLSTWHRAIRFNRRFRHCICLHVGKLLRLRLEWYVLLGQAVSQ